MARMAREEEYTYTPPNNLDLPFQLQDGNVYRWIRVAVRGDEDKSNISTRKQEGYEFVQLGELPEEYRDSYTDETAKGRLEGVVRKGDLALMRIPVGKAMARHNYYLNLSRAAERAIYRNLMAQNEKEHGRKVPVYNDSYSEVISGRRARFGDD